MIRWFNFHQYTPQWLPHDIYCNANKIFEYILSISKLILLSSNQFDMDYSRIWINLFMARVIFDCIHYHIVYRTYQNWAYVMHLRLTLTFILSKSYIYLNTCTCQITSKYNEIEITLNLVDSILIFKIKLTTPKQFMFNLPVSVRLIAFMLTMTLIIINLAFTYKQKMIT